MRVVAHLRGKVSPVQAYQALLFDPLAIKRIRSTTDLISAQPADEARYQAAEIDASSPSDLQVAPSLMSPDQPPVPAGYGNCELAIAQGSGGLSAATTDLARLMRS
jgi:hypothetical protein